jgi:NAD+ kinase
MNAGSKNHLQTKENPTRAIVLGAGGKPELRDQADQLVQEIGKHVEIVKIDFTSSENLADADADLAIVLGGDGSILRAARQMAYKQLPVVAVNLGKLGYLANVSPDELPTVLEDYKKGELRVVEHLMFECSYIQDGKVTTKQLGLNEVTVQGGMPFSVVNINLYVDSLLATTYSCDGLIICTPVGSTAHSLSAGGPILRQSMHAFVIMPLSPHTLTNRPVVDSDECVYEMEVPLPNPGTTALVDGRVLCVMKPGDRVRVEKSKARFRLIIGKGHDYYRTLREKLGWGGHLKLNK